MRKVFENRKKVIIRDVSGENYIFLLDEIIYGETEGRNLKICTDRGKVVTSLTLQKFLEMTGDGRFFCSHRAFFINMEHILSYSTKEILMDNGYKVFLSRGRSYEFRNAFVKWCFES